jgi:hypothetical protein
MNVPRAVIGAAAALAVGCSLLTNLTNLGADAAAQDSSLEGSSGDAAGEASADAGSDCGHLFCENFDDGTFAKWKKVSPFGGQLAFSSLAISPPNSLVATVPVGDAAPGPFLATDFPSASKIHLEIDIQMNCATGEMDVVGFFLVPAPAGYASAGMVLYQSPSRAHIALVYEYADGGSLGDAGDVFFGLNDFSTWHHFALDVDFVGATFQVLSTNDAGVYGATLPIFPALPPGAFELSIGIMNHDLVKSSCSVYFDNVTLDTQ